MARITVHEAPPGPPPKEYTLKLTEQEASELMFVLGHLGGGGQGQLRHTFHPDRPGPRLYLALREAGVRQRRPEGDTIYLSSSLT